MPRRRDSWRAGNQAGQAGQSREDACGWRAHPAPQRCGRCATSCRLGRTDAPARRSCEREGRTEGGAGVRGALGARAPWSRRQGIGPFTTTAPRPLPAGPRYLPMHRRPCTAAPATHHSFSFSRRAFSRQALTLAASAATFVFLERPPPRPPRPPPSDSSSSPSSAVSRGEGAGVQGLAGMQPGHAARAPLPPTASAAGLGGEVCPLVGKALLLLAALDRLAASKTQRHAAGSSAAQLPHTRAPAAASASRLLLPLATASPSAHSPLPPPLKQVPKPAVGPPIKHCSS